MFLLKFELQKEKKLIKQSVQLTKHATQNFKTTDCAFSY
jgi:hypothetical protein